MLSFLYAWALEGVCAERCVSETRSRTDSHLYRLQRVAPSAYVASVSRSEREMTVEGWKGKHKRDKGKRKLKRKAVAGARADRSLKHRNIYRSVSRWQLTANRRIQSLVWHWGLVKDFSCWSHHTWISGVCWSSRAGKTSNRCLSKAFCKFTMPQTPRLITSSSRSNEVWLPRDHFPRSLFLPTEMLHTPSPLSPSNAARLTWTPPPAATKCFQVFYSHLWHFSFLLTPPACSTPSQVPNLAGGKGKACIYSGSQPCRTGKSRAHSAAPQPKFGRNPLWNLRALGGKRMREMTENVIVPTSPLQETRWR